MLELIESTVGFVARDEQPHGVGAEREDGAGA